LSSAQGPAINASGSTLPKRMAPMVTVELGLWSTIGPRGRDHEAAKLSGQRAGSNTSTALRTVCFPEASAGPENRKAANRAPPTVSGAGNPKRRSKTAGRINSIAPRRRSIAMPSPLLARGLRARKGQQEITMTRRIVGDHHDTSDGFNAVGVILKRRIPEILRIMLLTRGEMDVRRELVLGE